MTSEETAPEGQPGLPFAPGSVSWDVLRRPVFFLGGMSALLLQLAEPRVARGVAEHSDFRTRIFDRLRHTIELMMEVGLGDPTESWRAVEAMERAHQGVRGRMADGSGYDAADPELRLWVLATLISTVMAVERTYVGEYDDADRRRYYRESLVVARALGVHNAPATLDDFDIYMRDQIAHLEVTEEARQIAGHILRPKVGWLPPSLFGIFRPVTADLLAPKLRAAYGLAVSPTQRRWLRRLQSFSRVTIPRLPDWIRTFPVLRPVAGTWDRVRGVTDPSLCYRQG